MKRVEGRLNLFWPVLIILVAVYWLFREVGSLPLAISDLSDRALPIVLVVFGLGLLLGRRVPYGNLIAIGLSALLLVGVTAVAYSQRSGQYSTAYQQLFNEPSTGLPASVTHVNITITTLVTQIEIHPAVEGQRTMSGTFEGSQESRAVLTFAPDTNTYTFTETHVSAIPMLTSVGKAKLSLQLPYGVTIDALNLNGGDGDLTFDASTSTLTGLTLNVRSGNVNAKLGSSPGLIGTITTGGGDVTFEVPTSAAAQISLKGGGAANPVFNNADYLITRDNVLEPQSSPNNHKMDITIDTGGKITIK